MRLDIYLTQSGLAKSRSKAAEYISGGFVKVDGIVIKKASYALNPEAKVELTGKPYDYVGRGGVKLEGALNAFGIDAAGHTACDIGASSGGFTDCLLKHGAAKVYAIDSGTEQLDPSLKNDPRVVSIEGFNARNLTYETINDKCGIIVSDLSFISQTYIIPVIGSIAADDAVFVSLIKPQFECGREALNKNGIVRDKKLHIAAIRRVLDCAEKNGFVPTGLMRSVITGGDGNVEYMFSARRVTTLNGVITLNSYSDISRINDIQIKEVVNETY